MPFAPPSGSLEEDLQILRIEPASQGWLQLLPEHDHPLASFYHAQQSASPSEGSGSEEENPVRLTDRSRIRPDPPNVAAAAIFMNTFLSQQWMTGTFAIAGGFAMILHGSTRTTNDVDICMEPQGSGLPLLAMIQNDRFVLPSPRMFADVMQFYLKTGPLFGDMGCHIDRLVRVEFLLGGGLRPTDFTRHTVSMRYRDHDLSVLDNFCLLRSKLKAFAGREALKDFQDIKLLIREYGPLIQSKKQALDQQYVQYFIEKGMRDLFREDPIEIQQAETALVHP